MSRRMKIIAFGVAIIAIIGLAVLVWYDRTVGATDHLAQTSYAIPLSEQEAKKLVASIPAELTKSALCDLPYKSRIQHRSLQFQ